MAPKTTIAIVNKMTSPVIRDDEKLIRSLYPVRIFNYHSQQGVLTYLYHLKLFFWLIINSKNISWIYTRYIDKQAFIITFYSFLFRKKCIIVPAGDDITYLPDLKFGILKNNINRAFVKFACRYTTCLAPVSNFAYNYLLTHIKITKFPEIIIIPNQVDTDFYYPPNHQQTRSNQVIIVAGCNSDERFRLKGLDTFIQLAKHIKNLTFIAIGIKPDFASKIKEMPENVILRPWLKPHELREFYRTSKYICNLSIFETFGRAFAEGMACGCIPITYFDIGPAELIENSGIIIPARDISTTIAHFKKLIELSEENSILARQIILTKYSFNCRKLKLQTIIERP